MRSPAGSFYQRRPSIVELPRQALGGLPYEGRAGGRVPLDLCGGIPSQINSMTNLLTIKIEGHATVANEGPFLVGFSGREQFSHLFR